MMSILLKVSVRLLELRPRLLLLLLGCLVLSSIVAETGFGSKPHIVVLLCDNVGWANVGFHNPDDSEVQTPNIDALAADGIKLDRHYTYKFCSPSRSSLLSGRLPVHVNIYNDPPTIPGQGVPVNMTLLPEKLAAAGYARHMIGKWHIGMATSRQTPLGRGFESSLGYFHSSNNYYDQRRAEGCNNLPAVDLWDTDRPSPVNGTAYEEALFAERTLDIIFQHDVSRPLFLYYALHVSCVGWNASGTAGGEPMSLQPPEDYYARFSFIDNADRRANRAMVAMMDDIVGHVVDALRKRGMWDSTLLLWSSDNGGAVHLGGGANSYPLRGGYYNNWEGGIRVAAALGGGFVPNHRRGSTMTGFIHEADWYATFCYLAGLGAADEKAAHSTPSLPAVDSLNVWPAIIGVATSPRTDFVLTPIGEDTTRGGAVHGGDAGLIANGRWKLLVGDVRQAGWCGKTHPNATEPWDSFGTIASCSSEGKLGCLFDVLADPEERQDLAKAMPQLTKLLYDKLVNESAHWFDPDRGAERPEACALAARTGYWQPFIREDGSAIADLDDARTILFS